ESFESARQRMDRHRALAFVGRTRRQSWLIAMSETVELITIGHGTLAAEDFSTLLQHHEIDVLVDVRAFPGSRRHPHFKREAMEQWVPAAGIEYRWERRLGGRRKPSPTSHHVVLRHESFRAY